ncbi:hypothetical protein BGW36DRAFT_288451 [Talaromyces proteolyticus]|uniref:Uncharacterized protein n=1 Tax=Talaromyces proteolyticus TaxID=1131652 RepID=A0AAD4L1T0_9EURO|nr:uncharacterized protein BGW36DRAFT_288451 [Talaromyces proteolyticus]KAH8703965.1 hypothetical protein BGW36DRAFT_288451 [Talaromyces proteolyticus]
MCALPLKAATATVMLDQRHPPLQQLPSNNNVYKLKKITDHNIVVIYLLTEVYSITSVITIITKI